MRLIPAIDLRNGRCVRLLRGDFAAETRYEIEPQVLLERYRKLGADWLHVVDLDGARGGVTTPGAAAPGATAGGRTPNRDIILGLASAAGMSLQVGGGLRDTRAVAAMLDAGVARVVVGSVAVTRVDLVRTWLDDFGAERIVLAFDVRLDPLRTPRVAIHGWQEQSALSLWDAVEQFGDHDLKHVLCTDVSRDGALSGPNVELYDEAARRHPHIAWQASGGIRDADDLAALERAGASAAISGKALLDGLIPMEELQAFLPSASFPA